jgi:diguanylate cyclase (GGDEF)-like protein/PAS domain S-box-containing protein
MNGPDPDAVLYRRAVAELPLPAMIHAEDGVVLSVNAAWCGITGYAEAQLPTIEAWTELAYGARAGEIQALIKAQFGQVGPSNQGEDTIQTGQGQRRWSYWSVPLGAQPDGRRVLLTTAVDRTEAHRAERALSTRERTQSRLLEHLPVGVLSYDSEGVVQSWNPAMSVILRQPEGALAGFSLPERLENPAVADALRHAMEGDVGLYVGPYTSVLGRHSTIVDLRFVPLFSATGQVEGGLCVVQDISHIRETEAELRLAAVAFETSEAILITNPEGVILRVNQAFTDLTGYHPDEVLGRRPTVLSSGRHEQSFYTSLWRCLLEEGHWSGEIWNRRKDGSIYPQQETITAVRDGSGQIAFYVAVFHDITERKEAEAQVHRLAFYDPLTALPNRRMLYDRLDARLSSARRYGDHGALLFLDLDRFKLINDALGHSVGDALLCAVADRIRGQLRREDLAARLGGDEFVLLLGRLPVDREQAALDAMMVSERVMAALREPVVLADGQLLHTDGSVGVVLFGPEVGADDAERLLREADTAMYRAKRQLDSRICFHEPAMQDEVTLRVWVEKALRTALAKDELRLYEQDQVDGSGRVLGVGTLVRWMHPTRGLLQPRHFIEVAEESGLIVELTHWVLRAAMARWRALRRRGQAPGWVAVKVSPAAFRSEGFVEVVLAALAAEVGPDGGDARLSEPVPLVIELTESVLFEDTEAVIEQMRVMHAGGVRFAIDDFGTGYSSLKYLHRLPIQQLKVDRSFVAGIGDPDLEAIVTMVISLGHQFALTVVAEGVETVAQAAFLKAQGCDALQGYLFGRPSPTVEPEPVSP